jgi:hypothetical protein
MDRKSSILLIIFFLVLAGSVGATYYRVAIARDYAIIGQIDCDPTTEKCFIYECDPETEECTGDPEEDTWYYKKINRKAFNIPLCDPNDENCEALVCLEGEEDCEEILCREQTMEEGDVCSDPEIYNAEHPEEEEVECEEGDEECASEEAAECEDPSGAEAGGDEECNNEATDAEEEEGISEDEDADNEEESGGSTADEADASADEADDSAEVSQNSAKNGDFPLE